jgi:hypothetical protein
MAHLTACSSRNDHNSAQLQRRNHDDIASFIILRNPPVSILAQAPIWPAMTAHSYSKVCARHRWEYWGRACNKHWRCYSCHKSAQSFYQCSECWRYICGACILNSSSSLDVAQHSISLRAKQWITDAQARFFEHGFVIIDNVLTPGQQLDVLTTCQCAAEEIVGTGKAGNRGPGRYSFGVASSTGSMLHEESFAIQLLGVACSKLYPLLEHIFDCGAKDCFICTGAGGDFVLGGTAEDQHLHSDMRVAEEYNVWWPPPMISVNFVVQDLTYTNGPTRMIPGTQLWRGQVPDRIPDDWLHSCLHPVPSGAAIIRDVRVLHSGTRNLTKTTRYLPSIEFISTDFRSGKHETWFPPKKCLPFELYEALPYPIKKTCEEIVAEEDFKLSVSYWKT